MLPLLASDNPFEHTWNTWEIHFYAWSVDLRDYEICRKLGITNFVLSMLVVALVLLLVGAIVGREARRAVAENRTPRGLGGIFEVIVQYLRDEVLKGNLPHHYKQPFYSALFCTFFFFILFCNLIGLLPQPFGHTPTGTPWVTGALAFGGTFLIGIVGGGSVEKGHGNPILGFPKFLIGLVPKGVPLPLWPLLFVIELVGIFVKPFALMIRLWANMTAGHIILAVLSGFLSMTFASIGSAIAVKGASAFGFLAITGFEIAIAFIQAYIFTTLSSVFVGAALSHEH
ncbi:MAG: F0F1 ATP synthase subunit A [Planctomycetes bacterium]|nr:F0F1 ATP synthase subunit A [Planctomycetota bacterium]